MKSNSVKILLDESPLAIFCSSWQHANFIKKRECNFVLISLNLPNACLMEAESLVLEGDKDEILLCEIISSEKIYDYCLVYSSTLIEEAPSLSHEICKSILSFNHLHQSLKLKIEISRVYSRQCWLFHEDKINLRLLQTFHGPGTEWLTEDNLNRAGLGRGDNQKIIIDLQKVRKVPVGDVALLKGSAYPKGMNKCIVHRSPKGSSKGSRGRFILKNRLGQIETMAL